MQNSSEENTEEGAKYDRNWFREKLKSELLSSDSVEDDLAYMAMLREDIADGEAFHKALATPDSELAQLLKEVQVDGMRSALELADADEPKDIHRLQMDVRVMKTLEDKIIGFVERGVDAAKELNSSEDGDNEEVAD